MLVLFDIDCTLLSADGAGMASLVEAGRTLYGPEFSRDGVEFAGRLDPLIVRDLLAKNDRPVTAETEAAMRSGYHAALQRRLTQPGAARALPGALDLVGQLRSRREVCVGLLTGNFPETGRLKLWAAGIDPASFEVAAWGDCSPHEPPRREHLAPVAIDEYSKRSERPALEPHEVVVIGDTPHDVACARASGCRVLAVATGRYTASELTDADRVVESLADFGELTQWILKSQ